MYLVVNTEYLCPSIISEALCGYFICGITIHYRPGAYTTKGKGGKYK